MPWKNKISSQPKIFLSILKFELELDFHVMYRGSELTITAANRCTK
jgi:hypothetical protein